MTLVGAGGTGKTRLSRKVARTALVSYPDGGWLVELASLAEGDYENAQQILEESLAVRQELGDQGGVAWCLEEAFKQSAIANRIS